MRKPKPKPDAIPFAPPRAPDLPPPPYVERHPGATPTLTDNGVAVVELMARELFTQEEVAGTLGLSAKVFRTVLGKADSDPMSPARAAWESGVAGNRGELQRIALAKARGGSMVEILFLLKAVHSFRDQGPSVQVDSGPRINFYSLPIPQSADSYLASLGMTEPIDTRPPEMRGLSPFEIMNLPSPTESNPTTEGGGSNAEERKATGAY